MSIIQNGLTSTLTYKNNTVTNRAPITFYGNTDVVHMIQVFRLQSTIHNIKLKMNIRKMG